MAYKQVSSSNKVNKDVVELMCDTDSDIDTLPTYYAPGSTCIVVDSSSVYILNTQGRWVML